MPDASTIEGGLFPDQTPDQFSTGDDYKASRASPSAPSADSVGDTKNRTYPDPLAPIPTKDLDSALDMVLNNYRQSQEDRTASIDYGKRTDKLAQDYDAHLPERKELLGKLKVPQQTPSPQFNYRSPIEAFGSLGTVIGALGSFFSRKPMTAAMKAMAAGMEGVYKNDVDTFNREYGVWKNQTELALKQADMENGIIKTILDDDSKSWDEKLNLVKSYGAALHDRAIFDAASSADARAVTDIAGKKIEMAERLRNYLPELDRESQRMQMLMLDPDWKSGDPTRMRAAYQRVQIAMNPVMSQFNLGHPQQVLVRDASGNTRSQLAQFIPGTGQWVTADDKHDPISNVVSVLPSGSAILDDQSTASAADLVGTYQVALPTGYALQSPFWQSVIGKVKEKYPEYDATQFPARSAAVKAFATGKEAQLVRSMNVSIDHLSTLQDLADALKNGNVQSINKLSQSIAQQTGDPAPTNFDAAKGIVAKEVVKAIVANGGGVEERREAEATIARQNSPAQLAGVIQTYKRILAGQLKGLKKQYEDTTKLKNFDDRLTPEARKELAAASEVRTGGNADIEQQAQAAWGEYDPSKYDYRINPSTGRVQRALKGQ